MTGVKRGVDSIRSFSPFSDRCSGTLILFSVIHPVTLEEKP